MGGERSEDVERFKQARKYREEGYSVRESCRKARISVGKYYEIRDKGPENVHGETGEEKSQGRVESLEEELKNVQDELKDTQDELKNVQGELKNVQGELKNTQDEIKNLRKIESLNWERMDELVRRMKVNEDTIGVLRDMVEMVNDRFLNHVHGFTTQSNLQKLYGGESLVGDASKTPLILRNRDKDKKKEDNGK